MLEHAFELRYQVYCVECGFLDASDYSDRRESDAYDESAAHFFAHNLQNDLVGYVRLIVGANGDPFPWEQYSRTVLPGVKLPDPKLSAEISRLMVRGDYRRRRGDMLSGVTANDGPPPSTRERRTESPQILLTLYRQMYRYSIDNGVRYWYAAMERPLARSLQRMSFGFEQIGPEIDYFGPVATYMADLRQLEANLEKRDPALLAWMQSPDTRS